MENVEFNPHLSFVGVLVKSMFYVLNGYVLRLKRGIAGNVTGLLTRSISVGVVRGWDTTT